MSARSLIAGAVLAALLAAAALPAVAHTVVIRHARVHTVTASGTLENADVLIVDGLVTQVGANITAPAGAREFEAKGRALTPGLFAGLTGLGVEEVSLEPSTVDNALAFGAQVPPQDPQWRPEFDITMAYTARSAAIDVNRVEGMTFTVLAPNSPPGGAILAGQGAGVLLDGRDDATVTGTRSLFIGIGGGFNALSGGSRAAQFMLLDQAVREARGNEAAASPLLTPVGRETLAGYLRGGRVVFAVDRAADIRRVVAFAQRAGMKPVISGGAEAWLVAGELARAKVPVLVDALANLPGNFDSIGARLDNAALLAKAGVTIAFSQGGDGTHNARKNRQLAGNAVAHGLPWDTALAALTANPAEIFGFGTRAGRIAPGMRADLVLWSGDPLEVTSFADRVWVGGKALDMRSRQTELRDRYLRRAQTGSGASQR